VRDFETAGELVGDDGGRIAAPHSSTALAINMFDLWRGRNLGALSKSFGIDLDHILGYERPLAFGLTRAAQPDIEFQERNGASAVIEVKLREPYGKVTNEFSDLYFETPGLWDGLPALHDLALALKISGGPDYETLHVAQLIKHALGLTKKYGKNFTLLYLWHYIPSATGDKHIEELAESSGFFAADVKFASFTVDELLGRLEPDTVDSAWFDYMTDRYVTPAGR
jgi:hypothetical protein